MSSQMCAQKMSYLLFLALLMFLILLIRSSFMSLNPSNSSVTVPRKSEGSMLSSQLLSKL